MFKKLVSKFKKHEASKVEDLEKIVEEILSANILDLSESRQLLTDCLDLMENEVKRVKSQANGYPRNTIAGDVWFDGAALANMGEALANYLSENDFLEEKSKVTNLWAAAVLSVCSHYHHMVGPAMIANAAIKAKTGHIEYSKIAYSAVLQDFECILEYAEEDEYKPVGDDLIALKSLEIACNKLVEFNELAGVNSKAPELLNRIAVVMEKPDARKQENN